MNDQEQTKKTFGSSIKDATLWDWLDKLVFPLVLLPLSFYVTNQIEASQQKAAVELEQQALLSEYIDRISDLALNHGLHQVLQKEFLETLEENATRNIAQSITASTLKNLDEKRRKEMMLFLKNTQLYTATDRVSEQDFAILFGLLNGAFLEGADLSNTLMNAIDLRNANLSKANLSGSDLGSRSLLDNTIFEEADLANTDFDGSILTGANFSYTDLTTAKIKPEQIEAAILCNTNIPAQWGINGDRDCEQQIQNVICQQLPDGTQTCKDRDDYLQQNGRYNSKHSWDHFKKNQS